MPSITSLDFADGRGLCLSQHPEAEGHQLVVVRYVRGWWAPANSSMPVRSAKLIQISGIRDAFEVQANENPRGKLLGGIDDAFGYNRAGEERPRG